MRRFTFNCLRSWAHNIQEARAVQGSPHRAAFHRSEQTRPGFGFITSIGGIILYIYMFNVYCVCQRFIFTSAVYLQPLMNITHYITYIIYIVIQWMLERIHITISDFGVPTVYFNIIIGTPYGHHHTCIDYKD